jgi:hypothetical protein
MQSPAKSGEQAQLRLVQQSPAKRIDLDVPSIRATSS